MSDSLHRSVLAGKNFPQTRCQGVTEADVLITGALASRPARQPDLAAENQALRTLTQHLMDDSQSMLKTIVRIALDLCGAGTVGVSLLETAPNGESICRWVAIAGALEPLEQTTIPGNFSPCGTTLSYNQPQLYSHPERCFTYLHHPQFSIVEELLIPLGINDRPLGTLWILSHDEKHRFDAEDQRLMMSLSGFAASALHRMKPCENDHKQAAENMRTSEERYRAIVNQAITGVAYTDLDGRLTLVNQKYCDITGYSAAELSQLRMHEITHPDDLPCNVELFNRMLTEGTPFKIEKRYIRKDNSIVWVNNHVSLIRDREGNPQSVVAIVVDITERKQAEAALRESEEQFRLFVTASSDMMYKMSADWSEMYHLKGKDFLASTENPSRTWLERYIPPDEQPKVMATIREAIRTKSTFELEHRVIQLDGTVGWTFSRAIPLLDAQNEIMEWFGAASDVTDRKQAEEAIRGSEEKYRTLFNSMDEGFCILQLIFDEEQNPIDYRYIEINPVFERQTGMKNALGRTIRELVPNIEPFWFDIYGRVARTGEPTSFIEHAKSLGRWFEVHAFRIGEPHEHKVAVLFNDISDRKRREANLAFLADIGEDFSRLSAADEIMQTVGARMGEYLKITTCNFVDVDEARGEVTVNYAWNNTDVPSVLGTFRITEYLTEDFEQASRAGETVIVRDTQTDPRTDGPSYAAFDIFAFVTVPFHRNGRWTYYLAITDSRPRNWRNDEIELIEELSNRIFPRLDRARTEAALRESEEKYRTLFNSMDEGYLLADVIFDEADRPVDIFYLQANPAAIRMTGLDYTGRRLSEIDPSFEPYWYEIFGRVAKTGEGVRMEQYAAPLKTWFDFYVLKIEDAGSCRVAVVFNDITNRKQAEASLRASEERLKRAIAIETVGVIFFRAEGVITDCNDAFLRMSGYSREDFEQGQVQWDKLTPPEWMPASRRAIEEFLTLGRTTPYEKEYIRKDGSRWWGLFAASRFNGTEGVEFIIDISERKQAEAEREQFLINERHYTNQLQGLTTAALAINSALSVEEVLNIITHQAESIIGAHQAVTSLTIDQNWAQAINTVYLSDKYAQWRGYDEPTDGSGIYACVCHLNRPMRLTQAELEAHPAWKGFGNAADKHPPMRGWLAAPLVGRDGHNIGLIQLSDKYEGEFTATDESILVQLAQMASVAVENARLYEAEQQARSAAEASREEAQAANRVKDEFLAVLSHELRSPLNPILGWSTLLQTRKLDEAKTAQALATIQRNAKLQSELIEDLLDVSRILRGKLSLNVAPVNLAFIIQAAMETVRLAADAKSITLEATLAPDVGLVSGDSTRLQQVVWNLLSNAVKFTPEGGQVNIRLDHREGHAYITVSDTGQGIAPDFLPYVFDYFRQANAATTRKFGGLGLGLAIVRHLVELHGGTVSADSPGAGQGATFTVRLPLMPTTVKANQDDRSPQQALDLNGINILVVDDEADTREFMAFLLEQQGAQVKVATSAHEVLLVLPEAKPDVLLSDIGMPDMDGYMLIQQVRALAPEKGGQIPAIALTAYAGEMNQQQALAAGFQRHLAKPIEPNTLVTTIVALLSEGRL